MSATPPARRRLNPAVTVRRAQSERRQLSPWQLPWSRGRTSGPETGRDPRDPPWGRVDHHHTPRTALIPPALPRMVGHSQSVLCGGLSPAGSMRHLPMAPVPSVQLPPIALGSPPTMLPPPHTLEDRLSQDRLSAFLAGEILPHQPRSILSCPESPLYESLVSIFTESEDTITIPDTEAEHEYQQIQPSQCRRGGTEGQQELRKGGHEGQQEGRRGGHEGLQEGRRGGNERQQLGGNSREEEEEKEKQQQTQQKMKVRKVNTLDVKPEKQCSNGEMGSGDEALCTCQNGVSPNSLWDTLPSHHRGQPNGSSSHSASSQDNSHSNKSAIYITNTSDSEMTDSDIYLAASLAPTVIHVTKPDRISSLQHIANSSDSNGKGSSGKQTSGFFSASNSQSTREKRFSRSSSSSSSGTTNNSKSPYSARNGTDEQVSSSSSSSRERAQVKARTKPPPDPVYPPLTIELLETKTPTWRPEQPPRTTKNKSTQVSLNSTSSPHIITTLDPPLKPNRLQPRFSHDSTTSKTSATSVVSSRDVPTTLVVNFDSENSDNDEATSPESDSDSCSSTLAGSTSIYLTDGDTSSIYSSVAEIYSVLTSDAESLVYVYRPQPRRSRHRYSTLSYRFPNYTLDRGGSSGGESSSGGSSGSSSQEGTITFVEPSYRPSNLSVGSRGHLKIDYSWSWNRLDDFVRTTSPKDVGKGGKGGGGGLDDDPYYSTIINHNHHHHHHHHQEPRHSTHTTIIPSHHHHHHHHAAQEPTLEPWERQLDPVAG